MRKTFLSLIISVLFAGIAVAQPQCIDDIWYDLKQNSTLKAKRTLDACLPDNQTSAELWLMKGNVDLQLHQYELDRKKKKKEYAIRYPNAILEANEAFYKSIQMKADVKPKTGMIDPIYGQSLCAPIIGEMALKALEVEDFDKAIELLNIAIRSYRAEATANKIYIAYSYIDLAICYRAKGDADNYLKMLQSAAQLEVMVPNIYLDLYDEYKQRNDTVNCGKVLALGKKVIPDSLALDLKGYELDFYAMCGQTEKFESAADELFEMYKTEPAIINIIVIHLLNRGYYEKAEPMILAGLAVDSNNFALNQQMGYRYYYEAIKYQNLMEEPRKNQNWDKVRELQAEEKVMFEKAHKWLEKSYALNPDDQNTNIMLQQMKIRLYLPVPEELKAKVDSYRKSE